MGVSDIFFIPTNILATTVLRAVDRGVHKHKEGPQLHRGEHPQEEWQNGVKATKSAECFHSSLPLLRGRCFPMQR